VKPAKSVGRIVGVLLLVQLAGLIVPFVMLHPITRGSQVWLANAAASSFQIKTAVFLLFANTALTIGIAVAAWSVVRRHSVQMALWLVALAVIMFTLQAVDNAHVLSMVSLSRQFAEAGGQDEIFQTLAAVAGSTRRWVHYAELLAIDAWMFVLYSVLFRYQLVPRGVAAFALLTVVLHVTGITLPLWLGYRSVTILGASMALGHTVLAVWLMARGFQERPFVTGSGSSNDDDLREPG
jgi:Domain of unknown function (DUF4386)